MLVNCNHWTSSVNSDTHPNVPLENSKECGLATLFSGIVFEEIFSSTSHLNSVQLLHASAFICFGCCQLPVQKKESWVPQSHEWWLALWLVGSRGFVTFPCKCLVLDGCSEPSLFQEKHLLNSCLMHLQDGWGYGLTSTCLVSVFSELLNTGQVHRACLLFTLFFFLFVCARETCLALLMTGSYLLLFKVAVFGT